MESKKPLRWQGMALPLTKGLLRAPLEPQQSVTLGQAPGDLAHAQRTVC
jgi:hypothetical protein